MKIALSLFLAAGWMSLGLRAAEDSFLLRGATIHTEAGADIPNGSILVRAGRITGVGRNLAAPKEVKVIDGKGLHVYPGMIDAATEVGLVEVNAVRETLDTTEIGRFNPQLVALDAVNPSSEHIPVTRANGITTVATMPEGPLISGQVSLMHLDGWTTDEMAVKPRAAVHMNIPAIQSPPPGRLPDDETPGVFPGGPRTGYAAAKQNYEKQKDELNAFFENARRYQLARNAKAADFHPDLKLEALIPVLEGREPMLITAVRAREILDAIAFAKKQRIRIIICEATEAYKVTKELKADNIPVILGPLLALPMHEDDPYDQAYTTAAELQKAGVRFALGTLSGKANLSSRNLPYQAAQAVAFGLPHDEGVKAITRNAAEIWGVGDQIGTIEEGKWADLMVTDGDPLEAQTQIRQLFVKGKTVDLNNRQKELYEKYLNRP